MRTTNIGTASVLFRPHDDHVVNALTARANELNKRNQLFAADNGLKLWVRPPKSDGSGVANGNTKHEFYRFVAGAMLKVPYFYVYEPQGRMWKNEVKLQSFAEIFVQVINWDWQPTSPEQEQKLRRLTIDLTVDTNGHVHGGTVHDR